MPSIGSLVSNFLKTNKWFLRNEDTGDTLEGQFAPNGVQLNIANNWAQHTALSRSRAIIQYLNSQNDTLSFQGMFFAETVVDTGMVEKKFEALKKMARPDPDLKRPPVVTFWVGNGFLEQTSVVDSINGVTFDPPTITGAMRTVLFTVNLLQYTEFSLKDSEIFETRYHRSRQKDYFELLAAREYGDPLIGDAIRKRHPDKPNLVPGAVVKLPSKEALRQETVEPKSIALAGAFGRADTPQRRNRIDIFNRRNQVHYSHVVKS